ncbi:hypothetical protein QQF64_015137 [Cirrhinus molitorella]|uniref:Uncharacterized protein n=1 Tax=Cirrhinus molitorella TaxID=172907 RepID=A0ABR3NUK0_9TELE
MDTPYCCSFPSHNGCERQKAGQRAEREILPWLHTPTVQIPPPKQTLFCLMLQLTLMQEEKAERGNITNSIQNSDSAMD